MLTAVVLASFALQDPIHEFDGDRTWGKLGYSLATVGDLDGDSKPDWVFAGNGNTAGHGGGGDIVVGYAQAYSSDGSFLWQVDGDSATDRFGTSVAGVSDLSGDGIADVLVGAYGAPNGRVYALNGVNGAQLFTLNGENAGDQFGHSVAGIEDLNSDGYGEFLVGAQSWELLTGENVGRVYLYDGQSRSLIRTWDGAITNHYLGHEIEVVGDVDGDTFDDFVTGAYYHAGTAAPGKAYVYSAITGGLIHEFTGEAAYDSFGEAVGGVGDVDGNGRPDIIVGARDRGDDDGKIYLYSGETGTLLWSLDGEDEDDQFGASVGPAGDVNGDGVPDILVGASLRQLPGGSFHGKHYVYAGDTLNLLWSRDGSDFSFTGAATAPAGDANGDGYDDVMVGSFGYGAFARGDYTGRVTVHAGGPSFELAVDPLVPGNNANITASENVLNGETVYFAYSLRGLGPETAPKVEWLQLGRPFKQIGTATVIGGNAVMSVPVRAGAPSGFPVYFQAALKRSGEWITSEAVATEIQ